MRATLRVALSLAPIRLRALLHLATAVAFNPRPLFCLCDPRLYDHDDTCLQSCAGRGVSLGRKGWFINLLYGSDGYDAWKEV
jgi:hypothetical protein